jgi:hypothetical protein
VRPVGLGAPDRGLPLLLGGDENGRRGPVGGVQVGGEGGFVVAGCVLLGLYYSLRS